MKILHHRHPDRQPHQASTRWQLPGLRGLPARFVLVHTAREFAEDDMVTYAAAFAFHMLFAIFPFALFLIGMLEYLELPGLFDWLVSQAAVTVPDQALERVEGALNEVRDAQSGPLLPLSAATALWIASIGMRSAMNALNAAYGVSESRPLWLRYLLSLVYTAGLAVLVVSATVLMIAGPQVSGWIDQVAGSQSLFALLWSWLRIPLAVLMTIVALSLVYFFAPNVEQRFRLFTPGAVLAVLLWLLASLGFRFFVANFGRYNLTYGSIGAIVVLLTYLYLCAIILLAGAEVNAVIQHHAPAPDDPKPKSE